MSYGCIWHNICQNKESGGLGFKNLHAFNQSFLMKLGWGLINDPDALWV